MAFDIYAAVTERIIQQLEQGLIPWEKPWTGTQGGAISGTTGKPYSLLNQMLLEKDGTYYNLTYGGGLLGFVYNTKNFILIKILLINACNFICIMI